MAQAWEEAALGYSQDILNRERASKIGPAFSQILEEARKLGDTKAEIGMREGATTRATTHEYGLKREMAREEAGSATQTAIWKSLVENYPSVAKAMAKQLGFDMGGSTSGTQAPDGTRLKTVKEGPYTYEAPEAIDAAFMIKEYSKYKTTMETNNTFTKNKAEIPGYKDWVQQNFPDYADEILRSMKTGAKKVYNEQELAALGTNPQTGRPITMADLEYTAKEEGMDVDALYTALLRMKKQPQQ